MIGSIVLAVLFAAGPRIGGETKDAKGVAHSGTAPELRAKVIAPVADGVLRCRPTFVCCGVCYGAAKPIEGLKLEYREKGEEPGFFAKLFGASSPEWKSVENFPYFAETKDYRGSIVDLKEDTEYEVRVGSIGGSPAEAQRRRGGNVGAFRTWKSEVKVAKTVVIDPKTAKYPIKISDQGTADGWIRYTVNKGDELKTSSAEPCIVVSGAKYVLVEGITFTGSKGRNELAIGDSENVRVVNCRFSHWGRPSQVCYDGLGRPYEIGKGPTGIVRNVHGGFSPKGGAMVNFDGAIEINKGSVNTVVERCWFHDCSIHANSWYYSHPAGGEGIMVRQPEHSTVIRWNDFTGSDLHRWNDAIESGNNFGENGGLNRDADVYGNFMIFAADDCIELDGGQQNVRCFDNRFESALCGVSIQGCMASPVYVFRNGFYSMGEEFGLSGQTIKTGGGPHGEEAHAYISDNLFWGLGSGITMMELLQSKLVRNVFCGKQYIGGKNRTQKSEYIDNQFEAVIDEAALSTELPVRPVGFVLDRARFSGIKLAKGVVTPQTLTVTAKSTGEKDVPFEVVWNDDTPWIKVEPQSGVIKAGEELRFTVGFDVAKMNDRRNYRGAFLVRTPCGLARGVSLYVETDFVPPLKAEKPGDVAVYLDAAEGGKAVSLTKTSKDVHTYEFTAPKDGRYYFMIHAKANGFSKQTCEAALDDEKFGSSEQRLWGYPVWTIVAPGNRFGNTIRFWDLKAGEKHVLKLKGGKGWLSYDKVLMTDNPGSFEPR